ncbi:MAG TPA: ABC transporter substrate-binding protein [Vicinamibacteria bacterium]|nr:ABC transporter substrate-binding protein [Vicinamibacteria bacterium]
MRRAAWLLAGLLLFGSCANRGSQPSPPRLVIALPSGVVTPLPFESNEEFSSSILRNVYDPLVELDEGLAARPGLAESWFTPDDLTWVFRLRSGILLHDGRTLNAGLIAQSLEQVLRDPRSKRSPEIGAVERIETPDQRTLVLKTSRPSSNLHNRLAGILLSVPGAGPQAPAVGSGPYRMVVRADGAVTLSAFEGYHEGPVGIREVEFRAVPSATERVRLLRSGQVHLILDVPPETFPALGTTAGIRAESAPGLRTLYLGLDCSQPTNPDVNLGGPNPLRDVRVRQALALAVDRSRLAREALSGFADPAHQIVPPEVFGFHPELPPWPHAPDQARRLLAEAGFPTGFSVSLDYPIAKYQALASVVPRLVADLAAVGIHVTPRPAEWKLFRDRVHDRHHTALYLAGWLNTTGDATVDYDYLVRTRAASGAGLLNAGGYSSPQVDALLDQAMVPGTPRDRRTPLLAVAERLREDLPLIPLYRQRDLYAFSSRLLFEPRPDRRIRVEFLRWRQGPVETPRAGRG